MYSPDTFPTRLPLILPRNTVPVHTCNPFQSVRSYLKDTMERYDATDWCFSARDQPVMFCRLDSIQNRMLFPYHLGQVREINSNISFGIDE